MVNQALDNYNYVQVMQLQVRNDVPTYNGNDIDTADHEKFYEES